MKELVKTGFNKKDIVSFGNMFLLANGRYGYRGTLEEYGKEEMVGLNVLGFYDRYEDKWRESINLPNPLCFKTYFNDELQSVLEKKPNMHDVHLNIHDATFLRHTEFNKVDIKSMRFVSSVNKDLIAHKYVVTAKESGLVKIVFKVDMDIYEINGPHFKDTKYLLSNNGVIFCGVTNEDKTISTFTKYISNEMIRESNDSYFIKKQMNQGDEICIFTYSLINQKGTDFTEELDKLVNQGFDSLFVNHINEFNKKWDVSRVIVDDEDSQFELDYSIYHLLILEDKESFHSVPARGLSGQTYKGAIFWDTEMFILPFFTLTNPQFARNLLVYRINTLEGAKQKAKGFGYEGAFYAWESQEDGIEQCSKYNVTDPVTNEPIRTYFDEKQIHISGDVALAFERYVDFTGDDTILEEGGYKVIYECAKFYMSRATLRNDLYHFDDVIGPDEYHERINDNAFTNYIASLTIKIAIKYFDKYSSLVDSSITKEDMIKFNNLIYLPKPNENGVIEQFDGYFKLKDEYPNEVKAKVKNEREYLGGLAKDTKTIKQADVVSLLAILPECNLLEYSKTNYDYYFPFTEHGSSLSSSMYSILGSHIGESEEAYKMFRKSSGIDLGTDQKMYAGGIYIGGTHPASNAGAYLSIIFGFAGLKLCGGPHLFPNLPKELQHIEFKFYYRNKLYFAIINGNYYMITEA